jgi:hypothetical protein
MARRMEDRGGDVRGQARGQPRALGVAERRQGRCRGLHRQRRPWLSGKVQVRPGDGAAGHAASEPREPETPQHAVETDLDAQHARRAVGDAHVHVADAHDPTPGDVDELRVEDVAREQHARRHRLEMGSGREDHAVGEQLLDVAPRDPRERRAAALDDDARHRRRGAGRPHAEIGRLPDPSRAAHHGRAEARTQQHGVMRSDRSPGALAAPGRLVVLRSTCAAGGR